MTNKKFWDDYPEEIKKRAIANCKLSPLRVKMNVLEHAFFWDNTPEQYDFWDLVNQGRYYEALELLDEHEIEKNIPDEVTQKERKDFEAVFVENIQLQSENAALKQQLQSGIQQMRMKVWADTLQTYIQLQRESDQEIDAHCKAALRLFDKTFGITSPEKQQS